MACVLAVALLALPGWTSGARGTSCCGPDCSPCPLSFCKTTRADRALVPAVAGLGPLAVALILGAAATAVVIRGAPGAARFPGQASFHPMRN